jgi:SHS2 domain-containing protein
MGQWRLIEDVALADCAMEVDGRDLADLFETAAAALTGIMIDPTTVVPTVDRAIALEADALDLLLYDWLSELIFLKDRDRQVFPRCRVEIAGDGPLRLNARVGGGPIDVRRCALRADPKAVTFHRLSVERRDGAWCARFVIDI